MKREEEHKGSAQDVEQTKKDGKMCTCDVYSRERERKREKIYYTLLCCVSILRMQTLFLCWSLHSVLFPFLSISIHFYPPPPIDTTKHQKHTPPTPPPTPPPTSPPTPAMPPQLNLTRSISHLHSPSLKPPSRSRSRSLFLSRSLQRIRTLFPFPLPNSFSTLRLSPFANLVVGILLSLFCTVISSTIAYRASPYPTNPNLTLSPPIHSLISPHTSATLITSLADPLNQPHIENALVRSFDIPPSLTRKIPPTQRYQLLCQLQNAKNTKTLLPLRLFVLHVVGPSPPDRLAAVATALAYARNTNRILLIMWDLGRGATPIGNKHPIIPIQQLDNHNIIITYVNQLYLTPNLTHWSEFQINYYTTNHAGGYPLDMVAALQTRHIFYRTHRKVEGRYASLPKGISMLAQLFRPSSAMEPAWLSFSSNWLFPHLSLSQITDLLNRVYGVPFLFLEGLSHDGKQKLLRALIKSSSKRAFFVHAQYGLGNRLRALGSAMAVAQVTGRVLVLIWEPDVHLNCRFSDLFVNDFIVIEKLNMNWPPGDANTKDHAMRTVDFYNFMRFNGKHIHNPLTELVNPRTGRHVYVKTAYVVRSSFTPRIISTHSRYWKLMREQLIPQAEIMYLVHDPSFINIQGMVGVHIRSRTIENDIKGVSEEFYGKGSRTTDHWRRLTGLKTFEAKIMRLSLRYKFFVAADSREAIHLLEQKFGSHRIFSIPRDKDCVTRDVECAKLALADILLLAKVPTLLGSHWSSFTEGAVRLSGRVKVLLAGVHFGRKVPGS